MSYYELNFSCVTDLPAGIVYDLLSSSLSEIGFDSFEERDGDLFGYVPDNLFDSKAIQACVDNFPLDNVRIRFVRKKVMDEDWNAIWERESFKPVGIEGKCLIRPLFSERDINYPYNIIIDPKMAFGTGFHETTRMMISWMLQSDMKGKSVLDMGCGTGVLAILACMMDALHVVAIDNDKRASDNALNNATLNKVDSLEVHNGDAGSLTRFPAFHYILANINRNILLRDIPAYAAVMQAGGTLFLSGFLSEDCPLVEARCREYNLIPSGRKQENDWVSLKVEKPQK